MDWGKPTKDQAKAALAQVLQDMRKSVDASKRKRTAKAEKEISGRCDEAVKDMIKWLRPKVPLTPTTEEEVRALMIDQFFSDVDFGSETGIVIAGFGADEVFPHLRSCEFQCSGFGVKKVRDKKRCDIDNERIGEIIPFAQKDMVTSFLIGRETRVDTMYRSFLRGYFDERVAQLQKGKAGDKTYATFLEKEKTSLLKEIESKIDGETSKVFIKPTMSIVSQMPKEEMALLAESLISLTSLKRKASRNAETVGGPTDVAVISKGDGFVWIKRKHYFDISLNPAYIQGYASR